ncbi:MAG TPA: hypothetical protein VEG30_07195 [Terriglobales bacterium]|nr:hypothetical protein [Terriglobales bacterium]
MFLVLSAGTWFISAVPARLPNETLLSSENAYNPIPSPDGKYIAFVRIGWNKRTAGLGRSSLISQTALMDPGGNLVAKQSLADSFLSGWTPDGSLLICYRDGEYSLVRVDGSNSIKEQLPAAPDVLGTERVSYFARSRAAIWSHSVGNITVLETPYGVLAQQDGWKGNLIAPSPNGRYLAIAGDWPGSRLWIYDLELDSWTCLGDISIHPDENWDYIKPSWNPWFADGSRLTFFARKNSVLVITLPDGKQRRDVQIWGTCSSSDTIT